MYSYRKGNVSVSLDVPRLLLKYIDGLGVNVEDMYQQIGMEPQGLRKLEGRLSLEKFNALCEAVIRQVGDPAFGLHFGEAISSFSSGHILFTVMMNCATLGDALERFCRYHGLLVDGISPQLRDEGEYRVFTLEQIKMLDRQYIESILTLLRVTAGRLTENRVRPTMVRMAYPAPTDISEHQRIFGAPIMFNQTHNGLVFDIGDMDAPIFLASPALLSTLEHFTQRLLVRLAMDGMWTGRASDAIGQSLLRGEKPSLLTVANALAISPRHLQNKLNSEGITYQKLLDSVRQQIAQDSLEQGKMTICDISFLLGFSEQSAFNHAFKRWTGMTPLEYLSTSDSSPHA